MEGAAAANSFVGYKVSGYKGCTLYTCMNVIGCERSADSHTAGERVNNCAA